MKTSSKGFVAIETALILLIVAIVAGTGYYVWHSQQTATKTLNTAQSDSATAAAKKPTATATKELTINQLHIQITPPARAADLDYYWDGYSAYLFSDSLGQFIKQTDPSCIAASASDSTAGKVGSIFNSNTVVPEESPEKQIINGNTYYYAGPQQTCDTSQKGADVANAKVAAVQKDITTAFHNATAN